jgi:hypothetical protein
LSKKGKEKKMGGKQGNGNEKGFKGRKEVQKRKNIVLTS